jgi:hypothetical protein
LLSHGGETLPRFFSFSQAGKILLLRCEAQQLTVGVNSFLLFAELFEALAATQISLSYPARELLITDIDALVVGVGLGPVALPGFNLTKRVDAERG